MKTRSKIWNKLPKTIKVLIKSIKVRLGLEILILNPYKGKYTVLSIIPSDISLYEGCKVIDRMDLSIMLIEGQIYYEENAKLFLKYL
jgi:hypothetical protein